MSLRRVEPENGTCPDGYEFVHGHKEKSGVYVRDFCRKISKKRIKMSIDMKYPGKTNLKISGRQGIHGARFSQTVDTESLFKGEEGEKFKSIMNADWKDSKQLDFLDDKSKRRNR